MGDGDGGAGWPVWDDVKGESAQKILLYRTLRVTGSNRSKAGQLLGISRETVRLKLRDWGGEAGLEAWMRHLTLGAAKNPSIAKALGSAWVLGTAKTARAPHDAKRSDGDKSIPANQLRGAHLLPTLNDDMSSAVAALAEKRDEPTTTVRLAGRSREVAVLGGAMVKNRVGGKIGASEFVSLVLEDLACNNSLAEYVEDLLRRRDTTE